MLLIQNLYRHIKKLEINKNINTNTFIRFNEQHKAVSGSCLLDNVLFGE